MVKTLCGSFARRPVITPLITSLFVRLCARVSLHCLSMFSLMWRPLNLHENTAGDEQRRRRDLKALAERAASAGTCGSVRGWLELLGFTFHLLPAVKVMALSRSPPQSICAPTPTGSTAFGVFFLFFSFWEDLSC